MLYDFKIIQKIDGIFVFQGLSLHSIDYLRLNGLWLPLSKAFFDFGKPEKAEKLFEIDKYMLYLENEISDILLLLVEQGEFLTGSVYSVIDFYNLEDEINFLHQYLLKEGDIVREVVQAVHNNIIFLALQDINGNIISDWTDQAIEEVLRV